jgi:EAL domain-containing protein (putative c-di-GMP-specific phosphodiesterase class I)
MSAGLDLPIVMEAVNRGEISQVVAKPFRATDLNKALEDALIARDRLERALRGEGFAPLEPEWMDECLNNECLRLAIQPIIETKTGVIHAYECLLRSSHEHLTHPGLVLQAAEQFDKIDALADQVAVLLKGWLEKLDSKAKFFVNLHPRELAKPDLLLERLEMLAPFRDRVVLEITERSYVLELDAWDRTITRLNEAGFLLAVDDLGSGYNALSVLAELQPAYIKVDMSIVRDVDQHGRKQRLIELLTRFGEATDAILIAEGVETEAEASTLRSIDVPLLQGYLFGKPAFEPAESPIQVNS